MTNVQDQFALIKRGAEEILIEQELIERLSTKKTLRVNYL